MAQEVAAASEVGAAAEWGAGTVQEQGRDEVVGTAEACFVWAGA